MNRKEWYDIMFPANLWYDKLRKEVRKKMVIDYREEWEKFKRHYGRYCIADRTTKDGLRLHVGRLMEDWIKDTINSREKLMEEFVRQRMTTNISKQDKYCYYVDIVIDEGIFGRFGISKKQFATWLKNRKKGGEMKRAEHKGPKNI